MNLDALIPQRLAFNLDAVEAMTGIPMEQLLHAIEAGDLSARYAGNTAVILRPTLVHWINTLHEWEVEQAMAAREDEIQTLRRQIDDLEHERGHSTTSGPKDLYFMWCESYIKIGVSQDPESRLKQIRRGSSMIPVGMNYALTMLLHVMPGAGTAKEQELHARFAHLRHTGEWFTEAPELTEYIDSLKEAPDASNAA